MSDNVYFTSGQNMKVSPALLFTSALFLLSGCSANTPTKVEQINSMHIPLILPGEKSPPIQTSHIASLYQTNKQDIDTLTSRLKKQYLQDVKIQEIFEMDSDVQPVYASLSKLEQLEMVNHQYLKDKNAEGLAQIHARLAPIIAG